MNLVPWKLFDGPLTTSGTQRFYIVILHEEALLRGILFFRGHGEDKGHWVNLLLSEIPARMVAMVRTPYGWRVFFSFEVPSSLFRRILVQELVTPRGCEEIKVEVDGLAKVLDCITAQRLVMLMEIYQ